MRRGDFVLIVTAERTIDAMVTLASANGRSLVLMFDGILGGWVGAMPVFQNEHGEWSALDGMTVLIKPGGLT